MVIGYCRTSAPNQTTSINTQEKACIEEAKKLGHESIKIIKDEGKSATDMKRPGLMRMIEMCKKGKVEMIITLNTEKLARNVTDHITLRDFFKENKIPLHYISETATAA